MTYEMSQSIPVFGDCIKVADKLSLDVSRWRQNIINYIPFAYGNTLEIIFKWFPDVNVSELNHVMETYAGKGDLRIYQPENLIALVEKYNISEADAILRRFINDPNFSIYNRRKALSASHSINCDETFLAKVFNKFKGVNDETYQLAEVANELLILKHCNESAFNWRIDQIKENAFEFVMPEGAHSVGHKEAELFDKSFARPLMMLKEEKFYDNYLDLLSFSFGLIAKSEKYWDYVQYLWSIVVSYVNGLREKRSYSFLRRLEKYIDENSSKEGLNWFKARLLELKRNYLNYIGKPSSITDCIKRYNELKTKQYEAITTTYELAEKTKEIVDKHLRNWIENQGGWKQFYKPFKDDKLVPKHEPRLVLLVSGSSVGSYPNRPDGVEYGG